MIRGIERRAIFVDDADRIDFVDRASLILPESGTECYAWALVENHAHLVLRTGPVPLARVMARLNTGYARYFNARHDRVGHLFQNRYKSLLVSDDAYLSTVVRYVHLNPLRACCVPSLAALADHPWSGHAVLMGRRTAPFQRVDRVLDDLGGTRTEARLRLLELMEQDLRIHDDGDAGRCHREPCDATRRVPDGASTGAPLGFENPLEMPATTRRQSEPERLRRIIEAVCRHYGIGFERIRGTEKRAAVSEARAAIAYLACGVFGVRGVAVAESLGWSPSTVSRAGLRGARIVAGSDALRRLAEVNM